MQIIRGNTIFFFVLLVGIIALSFFIFLPFLGTLVAALMVSILIRPIHRYFANRITKGDERSNLATVLTLLFVVVVVITPLVFLGIKFSHDARGLYTYLVENKENNIITNLNHKVADVVEKFAPDYAATIDKSSITTYIQGALSFAFTSIDNIFSKFASLAVKTLIFAFALYYLIRDGAHVRKKLIELSPLPDSYDEQIFKRIEAAIGSVVRGSLTAGLVQGILLGIGLAIFGVPNAVLWGTICGLAALLPGIGAPMIIIPAAIFLYGNGATGAAIGLIVWLGLCLLFVDNYLTPMLINKGIDIHPFLVLLSVFGGLVFFGVSGIILGPLVVSLMFTLLDIYKKSVAQPKTSQD